MNPRFVRVSAAGLGLMIYSPAAVRALEEGGDYMPARKPLREPLLSLVEREQRVVLLGTGSPQLDYAITARVGRPMSGKAKAKVTFGLHVEGDRVCVRDGYDPMQWTRRSLPRQTFSMADGYYAVHASWVEGDPKDDMTIVISFERRTRRVRGSGWPYLAYRV